MELWELKVEAKEVGFVDPAGDCTLCNGMCLRHSVEDACPGVVKCMRCEVYSSDLSMIRCPCCDGCMVFLQEVDRV